jgi:hypothetical protein
LTKEEQQQFEEEARCTSGGKPQIVVRDIQARGWKERVWICMMACSKRARSTMMQQCEALVILVERGFSLKPLDMRVLTRRGEASWL